LNAASACWEQNLIVRSFVLAASIAMLCGPDALAQERVVATYGEARTNLAFRIPEPIVQKILPPEWLSSPFTAARRRAQI
jgi:hypothetical protein